MDLLKCLFPRNHQESSGNSKTTFEEVETTPHDVTLEDIVEELLSFLNKSARLTRAKTEIIEKCNIEKESGYCWSADDIKRAWKETQKITKKQDKRNWSLVILFQVIKCRLYYEECERKEAQSDLIVGANSNSKTTPEGEANLEDYISNLSVNEEESVQNDRRSTDGFEEACKENPDIEMDPDTSTQSNVEPLIPSRGPKRKTSSSLLSTSGERDDLKEVPREANSQTVYIRIPFSVMAGNESPSSIDTIVPDVSPTYKLIDRVPNLTEIRKRKSYAMLYDNRTRNAAWVYEILNSETLKKKVERKNAFSADQSIHPFFRASNVLYKDSYDRGHLAAANNHKWCRKACDDTFLMSNISPQHLTLNRGKWNSLENICQKKIKENIRNVHVYSGPLYPGDGRKVKKITDQVVPSHFFKVIIVEHEDGKAELECYVMLNDASGDKYTVSIEYIERASGLIFRENSCSGGETESLKEVTWTGENEDEGPCTVTTHVNISTPHA